jgi:hypothetical protein
MSIIGTVESLWRYPVKSMRGEELDEAFAAFSGIYGDRSLLSEVRPVIRGFHISRLASSEAFSNIVRVSGIRIKRHGPSI